MPASVLLQKDISFCETLFEQIDRCISQGQASESAGQPYARMQVCKPHWVRFSRCVKRRDKAMMNEVLKWEDNFLSRLSEEGKKNYAQELDMRHRYLEYRHDREIDFEKKQRLQHDLDHIRTRAKSAEVKHGFPPALRA